MAANLQNSGWNVKNSSRVATHTRICAFLGVDLNIVPDSNCSSSENPNNTSDPQRGIKLNTFPSKRKGIDCPLPQIYDFQNYLPHPRSLPFTLYSAFTNR